MDLIEAIEERRSTRAFLDRPVDRETLEKLLRFSVRAPSAINLQPWEFTVVSGEERRRLSRLLVKRMRERNISCGPSAKNPLPEYFVERQRGLLNVMLPGLPENTPFDEFINEGSCNFYGAPVAIIICLDDSFSKAHLVDIGVALGYLLLAAHGLGLATCPIGLIAAYEDEIKDTLNIPENKKVIIGVALGYPDWENPLTQFKSPRENLNKLVKWIE